MNDSDTRTESPSITTVALVGHCGPDSWMLRGAVERWLPNVEIVMVGEEEGVESHAGPGTLMLVNRVLDGDFGGRQGLDLVADLAGRDDGPTVMLVSNYDDAQREAEAAGAVRGFGKSAIGRPETADRVRLAAGLSA